MEIKQVAKELGVQYVLEGSMRRAGHRVRVSAQLIDAVTSRHIWAERYDCNMTDVFEMQDEITGAVAHAIEPAVALVERQRAVGKSPERLDAWEAYQRGMWHLAKFNQNDVEQARCFFRLATELAPLFAVPHAMLGFLAIATVGMWGNTRSLDRIRETAEAEARIAIDLDPDLSSAHGVMAWAAARQGHHAEGLEHAVHALSMGPNDVTTCLTSAQALIFGGRPAEGREAVLRALRHSPRDSLRAPLLQSLTIANYTAKRYEDAVSVGQVAIREFPTFPLPYRWVAAALGQLGCIDDAREALQKAIAISQDSFEFYARSRQPWMRPTAYEHMLDGLHKAGWQG